MLSFLRCSGRPSLFLPSVLSQVNEKYAQFGWGPVHRLARIVHFFAWRNFWVPESFLEVCFGSFSIYKVTHHPVSLAAFGWIWTDKPYICQSLFFYFHQSSINTIESVPRADKHAHAQPPCLIDGVVCFRSWASPFSQHFLQSLWLIVILDFIFPSSLVPDWLGFFRCFQQKSNDLTVFQCYHWFAPCHKPPVFTSRKASFDLDSAMTCLPPSESSWLSKKIPKILSCPSCPNLFQIFKNLSVKLIYKNRLIHVH